MAAPFNGPTSADQTTAVALALAAAMNEAAAVWLPLVQMQGMHTQGGWKGQVTHRGAFAGSAVGCGGAAFGVKCAVAASGHTLLQHRVRAGATS